jgi:hypothetical protein
MLTVFLNLFSICYVSRSHEWIIIINEKWDLFLLFLTTTCAFNKEMWSFIPRCAQNKKCLQVDIDIDMISVDLIAHCTSDKLVYLIFIE